MPSAVRPSRNHNPAPRAMPLKRARFWLICLFFLSWAILIAVRLFWLQVVRHGEFHGARQAAAAAHLRCGSAARRAL